MYCPLPLGSLIAGKYEITTHIRRIRGHNLYSARESATGLTRIINEYLPDVCTRKDDLTLSFSNDDDRERFELSLNSIISDASLIMSGELNQHYRMLEVVRENSTAYIICDNGMQRPAYAIHETSENIREINEMDSESRYDLFLELIDFAADSLDNLIFCIPDMENTGIMKDDFRICYCESFEKIDAQATIKLLCTMFYYFQFGVEYRPGGETPKEITDDVQIKTLELIVSGIEESYKGDLISFKADYTRIVSGSVKAELEDKDPATATFGLKSLMIFVGAALIVVAIFTAISFFIFKMAFDPVSPEPESNPAQTEYAPTPTPKPVQIIDNFLNPNQEVTL